MTDMTLREPMHLRNSAEEAAAWAVCLANDSDGTCSCTRKTGPCQPCRETAARVIAALRRGGYMPAHD